MLTRTILSVPANSPKMLLNADYMGADIILFDLEDSVPPDQKSFARELLRTYLSQNLTHCTAMVRVNDVKTPFFLQDLEAVLPLSIIGIMLPKMEEPADIAYADAQMTAVEQRCALPPEARRVIIGTIETALGVENAYACLSSSSRVIGCSFGSEDFAVSMGVSRSADNMELEYARRRVVIAAKAAGKIAVDTVFTNVHDDAGLRAMTEEGKQLGYDGKFIISPRQVPVVHEVYTPSPKEIAHALAVTEKMKESMENGTGVAVLNGKMLDKPVLQQAQHILDLARSAGVSLEKEASHE